MSNLSFKNGLVIILVIITIGIVLCSGCTGTDDTQTESSGQSDIPKTEETTSAQETEKTTVQTVHYTKLIEFLPTATGNWEQEEPVGLQMTEADYAWSWASKGYDQKMGGDARVDIIIQDTGGYDVGYMAGWEGFIEFDSTEASFKSTTVQGYPAWIGIDKIENTIAQYVNVDDRFIVYTLVTDGKEDYLTVFNGLMNLKGLAALG
ncbi:hypothetical protein F1737_02555 [Methanoplanus sp. FWC-SCC4]|uniref:Uncharacterized protein n=1 Tax=Methanochimaera problematica TaxID=2609417 RepID=A0AA97I1X5_9EURY|nr:hypothetical protein [Methanoplanus sp. FWC-SCC4]WOF15645.1 hypothetical protein F1737_02555 [Methanoplanus sp. FWC-SCC4]